MATGIEIIAAERRRQIDKGLTIERDVLTNNRKQLVIAASFLLYSQFEVISDHLIDMVRELSGSTLKDWDMDMFIDMMRRPYEERVRIAGALCAAELDRLNNQPKGLNYDHLKY